MRRLLYFALFITSVTVSCSCYKEDCVDMVTGKPLLAIYADIKPQDTVYLKLYRTPKGQDFKLSDSLVFPLKINSVYRYHRIDYKYAQDNFLRSGYDYLLVNSDFNVLDTITDYSYSISIRSQKTKCCSRNEEYHIENVSFRYNGRLVQGGMIPDTLILK